MSILKKKEYKLLDKHQQEVVKRASHAAVPLIELVLEMLKERKENYIKELESKTIYNSAHYSERVADNSGARRELNYLIDLLTIEEDL